MPPRRCIALVSRIAAYDAHWRPKRQPWKNSSICWEDFSQGELRWADMIVFYLKVELFSFAALCVRCCLPIGMISSSIRKGNSRQFAATIETLSANPNAGKEVNTKQCYKANAFHVTKIQYYFTLSVRILLLLEDSKSIFAIDCKNGFQISIFSAGTSNTASYGFNHQAFSLCFTQCSKH